MSNVEIVRHWRNNRRNLRLEGFKKTSEGTEKFSINGISWFEPSPNAHHKEENPLTVIFQAQTLPSDNGRNENDRKQTKISGTIKIPASVS